MSLQVWLPLNGNLNNQGLGNPTISGTATYDSNGKMGQCLNSSGAITLTNTGISGSRVWSVCFWGYVTSSLITTNWTGIIRLADGSSTLRAEVCPRSFNNGMYVYSIHNNPGALITSGAINSSKGPEYYDTWVHFCLTSDGTTIRRYMNGILDGSIPYNGSGTLNGTISLNNNYQIKKNDFRVYNHCLSEKEVKEIAKGLCLHYKLDNNGIGGENLLTDSKREFIGTIPSSTNYSNFRDLNNCISPKPNEIYTCSFDAKSSIDNIDLAIYLYNNASGYIQVQDSINSQGIIGSSMDGYTHLSLTHSYKRYWITWQFNNVEQTIGKTLSFRLFHTGVNANFAGETAAIKNIKLEKGSKATAWCPNKADAEYATLGLNSNIEYDCSGFGNNGTKVGTLQADTDSSRYNSSTYFDGNSYITLDKTFNLKDGFTFTCWVNYKEDLNRQGVVMRIPITVDGSSFFNFGRDGDGSGMQFIVFTDNSYKFHATTGRPLLNHWDFFCGTWNGTINKFYQNGKFLLAGTKGDYSYHTNAFVSIGTGGITGASNVLGNISDVRIYSTVLSEDDIKELYQVSASIDNKGNLLAYEFKEE